MHSFGSFRFDENDIKQQLRASWEHMTYLQQQLGKQEHYVRQLQDETEQLKRDGQEKDKKNNQLRKQLESLRAKHHQYPTIYKQHKPWASLSRNGRWERKRNLAQAFRQISAPVHEEVKRIKVELEFAEGEVMSLIVRDYRKDEEKLAETVEKEDQEKKILQAKDQYRISYDALHALRRAGVSHIPSKYSLLNLAKRLSTYIPIIHLGKSEAPDGYCRPLADVLEHMLKLPKHQHLLCCEHPVVTLRFACDGAKITKTKNAVRGVCKLILPEGQPQETGTPEDEATLFLYMGKEEYGTLLALSTRTRAEMAAASKGIQVGEKVIRVNWLLCSDWKAMAMIRGINQASSHVFCLWCKCNKSNIKDFTVEQWPVSRSATDQTECLSHNPRDGYIKPDLVPFIPYTNMIPDELHLRIRISSKLFNQVVKWVIEQNKTAELTEELKKLNIPFHFTEEQGDDGRGKIKKWTQLNGDALESVLQKLPLYRVLDDGVKGIFRLDLLSKNALREILEANGIKSKMVKSQMLKQLQRELTPQQLADIIQAQSLKKRKNAAEYGQACKDKCHNNALSVVELQLLWEEFSTLMVALKTTCAEGTMDSRTFQDRARKWAKDFIKVTSDQDLIPYIHCLVYHVPQSLAKFSFLPRLGITQLERKNYDHHLAYFFSSSKQGGKARKSVSLQILERENRLMAYISQQKPQPSKSMDR